MMCPPRRKVCGERASIHRNYTASLSRNQGQSLPTLSRGVASVREDSGCSCEVSIHSCALRMEEPDRLARRCRFSSV